MSTTASSMVWPNTQQPLPGVRRIVTGVNEAGRSFIVSDGVAPNRLLRPSLPGAHVLWATGEGAASGDDPAPEGHDFGFHSKHGSLLRVVDFPPDHSYDPNKLTQMLDENGVRSQGPVRHFWFHKTQSLDYAIVLEGEIYAMLDEGETLMRAGDILIQRATNHSWSNRTHRVCRMAFVLLDWEDDSAQVGGPA